MYGHFSGWKPVGSDKGDVATLLRTAVPHMAMLTLGMCGFIMGYLGWWGGIAPPEGTAEDVTGSLSNRGLMIVLVAWLVGLGSYKVWRSNSA